jgi:hypothetical protein
VVKGRAEVTVKFSEVPQVRTDGDKVTVEIVCEGWVISTQLKAKSWRKAVNAMMEYPQWVASLNGKLGQETQRGFTLMDAGVQVFEKKPKETKPEPAPEPVRSIMQKPVLSLHQAGK